MAKTNTNIAILGGGISGLYSAYLLAKQGKASTIYEAQDRLGGRIQTYDDFHDGQFCEGGAELIDSHTEIFALCEELGVPLQQRKDETSPPLTLAANGRVFSEHEIFKHPELIRTLVKFQEWIAIDPALREQLDLMPLDAFLEMLTDGHDLSHRVALEENRLYATMTVEEKELLKALIPAYESEVGGVASQQSALNLIEMIARDANHHEIYGLSDEKWRVFGGSSRLIEALVQAIENLNQESIAAGGEALVTFHLSTPIYKMEDSETGIDLTLQEGTVINHQQAICTLPFSVLREMEGIDDLPLTAEKKQDIHELGYGHNTKVFLPMLDRAWEHSPNFAGKPFASEMVTDKGALQSCWITTIGQQNDKPVMTILVGGEYGDLPPEELVTQCRAAVAEIYGMAENEIFPDYGSILSHEDRTTPRDGKIHPRVQQWSQIATAKCSYASPKPGQWTSLVPHAGTPEMEGRLIFAGEHTDAEWMGFMNGAVRSAARAVQYLTELEIAPEGNITVAASALPVTADISVVSAKIAPLVPYVAPDGVNLPVR